MSDAVTNQVVLHFHAAWGEAKDRPDYHKPNWIRAQAHHERQRHTLAGWLLLVANAPGPWHVSEPGYPGAKS